VETLNTFFGQFLQSCDGTLKGSTAIFQHTQYSPLLVSGQVLDLDIAAFDKIRHFIGVTERLVTHSEYASWVGGRSIFPLSNKSPAQSLFSSYDFHVTGDQVKLIEINTAASGCTSLHFLRSFHQVAPLPGLPEDMWEFIRKMFLQEAGLSPSTSKMRIAIVDEKPSEQRAYYEFLIFQKLFESWGWTAEIVDVAELKLSHSTFDLIYNRCTDFYLQDPASLQLKSMYENNAPIVSPHPYRYFLSADKSRHQDLRNIQLHSQIGLSNEDSQLLQRVIPQSWNMSDLTADELWKNRKHLFFKPKQSYGAKAVYNGASISHKMFESLDANEYLAQEFVEPNKVETEHGAFKYDLRFYTYGSQIFCAGCRLYQGQATNFKVLGGGFAPLRLSAAT
jgi:hypothetical protein